MKKIRILHPSLKEETIDYNPREFSSHEAYAMALMKEKFPELAKKGGLSFDGNRIYGKNGAVAILYEDI